MPLLDACYGDYSDCCVAFRNGIDHLRCREINAALYLFEQALESVSNEDQYLPVYCSYLGFARVLAGDARGRELCHTALNSCISNGDLYLNIARLEWYSKNRRETVNAIAEGLRVDHRHEGLRLFHEKIGKRKYRPVNILPRDHFINNMVGRMLRK